MQPLHQQIRDDDFSNWLDVAVAISVTTKGISDYLNRTILDLHGTIKYGSCAQLPMCTRNCSRTEQNFSTWCHTCTEWKKQIMLYNRFRTRARKIKWGDINSSEWPYKVDEMVKVFAPDWWKGRTPYTEDLVVAMSIFHNCTEFKIPIPTCNRVRDIRNALFAHGQLKVARFERNRALKDLIAFIKCMGISATKSGKISISQLKRLKANSVLKLANEEATFHRHLVNVLEPPDEEERKILQDSNEVNAMKIYLQKDKIDHRKTFLAVVVIGVLLLVSVSITYLISQSNTGTHDVNVCMPLTFSGPCPWEPDITFDGYLNDRPVLYGREWLFNKIQTSLFATSSRGVLLTAEMGYGKSTFVSNLLCTFESEIRKFILSYHICKFDVISTQRSDYFIKNLAGMLISNLPEAGNAILTNEHGMKFLTTSKCSEDPIGCLDAAIIHPLQGLQFDQERYVIIDAIDECGDSSAKDISLLDVLSRRISKMPWWLKFFITARDITMVTDKFSGVKLFHESSENIQNQNDISTFLSTHTSTLTRLFGKYTDFEKVKSHILRISGSNFLYVDLAVKFWRDSRSSTLTDIPQTFTEFYNANLDRVFGKTPQLYDLARNVFEVLCTSYKELRLEELEGILNVTKNPQYHLRSLLGNHMSHFVKFKKMHISIYHKAICDHLSDKTSVLSKYHISKPNGHKLFANYLLSKYNLTRTDTIDMLIHVAESNDSDLQHSLKHNTQFLKESLVYDSHLHQMAKSKNSFLGTKLLISVLGKEHINTVRPSNVSATFLAAAFGNAETLRALIEEGGDYHYRVPNPPEIRGKGDVIYHCKCKHVWGYGLLDIASQNGHLDVVELLLYEDQTLLYSNIELSFNAVHLAAEHGHTEILTRFLAINSTLADGHALYLASKHGHMAAVLSLLDHGATDTCVPCLDIFTLYNNYRKRIMLHPCYDTGERYDCDLILKYEESENVLYARNGDERLIKCKTALDISIQKGFKDIVSHLLSQNGNALPCREYGGRTPILTAIKYNQSDILDLIIDNGGNLSEKCVHSLAGKQNSNNIEISSIFDDICPLGAGVEHLLAMDGRLHILKHLRSRGLSLNWTAKDEYGNTPLHYTACNNEWEMTRHIIEYEYGDIYDSATNGSLPIHSAVLCNAPHSYVVLQLYYVKTNKPLVDSEGRGLFHYLALGSDYVPGGELHVLDLLLSDRYMLKTSTKDTNSSNYLHYAAEHAKMYILINLAIRLNVSVLLEENDMNKSVIDTAFDNLPHQKEYRYCVKCSIADMFYKQANDIKNNYLETKEELIVFRIFRIISEFPDIQRRVNFPKYHRLAIMKGNAFILLSIIKSQPHPFVVNVDKNLLNAFFSAEKPPIGMLLVLSSFVSDFCNKSFEESLLHRTIRNEDNKYWIYWAYSKEFANAILAKPITFWENCYDRDGNNLLHHAVMGGNFVAVEFLINSGMKIQRHLLRYLQMISFAVTHSDNYVGGINTLRHSMTYIGTEIVEERVSSKWTYFEHYFYSMTKNYVKTASYVISAILKENRMNFSYFCQTKSKQLSLVHQVSIKGHLNLLVTMYKRLGKNVLQCKNIYQFTPLYFAKIFKHLDMIKYLQHKSVSEVYPNPMAESVFLETLATDDVSELRYVPDYVHFIVKSSHPYLYHGNPTYKAIFRRSLIRQCSYFYRMSNKTLTQLKNRLMGLSDIDDMYVDYHDNEILWFYIIEIQKESDKILKLCHDIHRATQSPSWLYTTQVKRNVSLLSKNLNTQITVFHVFYSMQIRTYLSVKLISKYHDERIMKIHDEMIAYRLSLKTITEFYVFRRKFVDEEATKHFPRKSDLRFYPVYSPYRWNIND